MPVPALVQRWRRCLVLVPLLLLAVVLACDALMVRTSGGIVVTGLLDEPAHLATAALVMLALVPQPVLRRHAALALTALTCAVAIDIDHVPLYLGVPGIADGGRPVTHSLATVAVLLVVAALLPRPRRPWPAAAAVGVCLHFVRDVATGPGLPLVWPVTWTAVVAPYPAYVAVLVAAAVAATVRLATAGNSPLTPTTASRAAARSHQRSPR